MDEGPTGGKPFDVVAKFGNRFEIHSYSAGFTRMAFGFRDPDNRDQFFAAVILADVDVDALIATIKQIRAEMAAREKGKLQ